MILCQLSDPSEGIRKYDSTKTIPLTFSWECEEDAKNIVALNALLLKLRRKRKQ